MDEEGTEHPSLWQSTNARSELIPTTAARATCRDLPHSALSWML
jgi:hypothetical protein